MDWNKTAYQLIELRGVGRTENTAKLNLFMWHSSGLYVKKRTKMKRIFIPSGSTYVFVPSPRGSIDLEASLTQFKTKTLIWLRGRFVDNFVGWQRVLITLRSELIIHVRTRVRAANTFSPDNTVRHRNKTILFISALSVNLIPYLKHWKMY